MAQQKKRPLSPHLQVYKPQITSVLSIMHRMTEVAILIGLFILTYVLLSLTGAVCDYNWLLGLFKSVLGQIVLFSFTLAMFYNVAYAIRHFFWTINRGFELQHVYKSGFTVLGFTVIASCALWYFILTGGF